ncbi:MAG TPA: DNA mismatch repair protein MutS [Methylomirabilota bacterium]
MPDLAAGPRAEYRRRADRHRARAADAARREETISRIRLGVAVVTAVLVALAFVGRLSPWWLLAPAAAFGGLLVVHARARRRRRQAERGVAFHERGLARLDGQWAGTGRTGARFVDPHHPYAEDLDMFGEGSLYELLCGARTTMGEDTLAAWLLAPADLPTVRARQAAVQELAPRLDLREDLAILGEAVAETVRPDSLAGLAAPVSRPPGTALRLGAAALTGTALGVVALWAIGWTPLIVALGALGIQGLVHWRLGMRVRDTDRAVAGHGHDLDLLAAVLDRFEREPLTSPLLAALRGALTTGGRRPSEAIGRLRRLVDLFDSRRNEFFKPVALLTMWDVHCALAIEAWRARHGAAVPGWLAAVGQLEALGSLAGFAYEHPADVYPDLDETRTRFEAEGLGHPLMAEARCVRNDVALGDDTRVLIVSGSNMSGKSTLLRAVGVNAVLALAGAPVRARRLRLSRLSVGATLRIRDSLQEGTSRFYAELVRLRDLVRIAEGSIPLLFLLDEILHGTNSHDRRLGAAAVVRGLVQRGAIGLVTTHDLALSDVANDPDLRAVNVHFEDRLDDGAMVFDYRMRPGVVQTSNALALMRTLGLLRDGPPA